jgi:hypothetical protein
VAASTTALLILLANRLILPGTDTLVSPRPAAMWAIQGHSLSAGDVVVYSLPRAYGYGLNYYFNATLTEWTPENTSAKILFVGRDALNSPQLESLRGKAEFPATGDGKIFLVLLNSD